MYIRETKTKGKYNSYIKHSLVEAYRDNNGSPRQRTILQLGTIDIPKNRWKELAFLLEQRVLGQSSLSVFSSDLEKTADELYSRAEFAKSKVQLKEQAEHNRDLVKIDLNSASFTDSRSLGPELAADFIWRFIGVEDVLKNCGMSDKQISVAQTLICGKLISPSSEIETWRWFNNRTALAEMTPENIVGLGKDSFYDISDLLYKNKENIEIALFNRETSLFALERRLFLFDLTNTYIEGSAKHNEKGNHGKSKEKRTDCPLISLALVVDEKGFPVYSRIYKGNQSEPQTFSEILLELKKESLVFNHDQKPVIIMDRGIATKGNIDILKEEGFSFTVIERSPKEREYVTEFSELKAALASEDTVNYLQIHGWQHIGNNSDVFVKGIEKETCTNVLALSLQKEAKELSIDRLKEERFLEDITKLKKSVESGNIILSYKVSERIGRLRQKYIGIAGCYDMEIETKDDKSFAKSIRWTRKDIHSKRMTLAGCYVIETDRKNLSAEEIWNDYTTITRVESAFRDLKSELGLRPIYHQKEERTDAHLFIGVLAYHLLVGIESILREKGDHREWKTIKSILSTHQRSTIILTGEDKTVYNIRVSGKPEEEHLKIYDSLGIKDRLKKKKWLVNNNL